MGTNSDTLQASTNSKKKASGCLGYIGVIVVVVMAAAIFSPSKSNKPDATAQLKDVGDSELNYEVLAWLTAGKWKCVDASTGGGIIKGANFEFTGCQLHVFGCDAEATHSYEIQSVRKSGENTFATLVLGKSKETLIKMPAENGFDLAGFTWGDGKWTLKLARSAR